MIYMLFEDGYEEVEAIAVIDVLRRADIEVKLVGMKDEIMTSAHGVKLVMDMVFDEEEIMKDAQMILLPGGQPGTDNLNKNEDVIRLLKAVDSKNAFIGAICAAPTVLDQNGILKGKRITCYPTYESKIQNGVVTGEDTWVDGNIITGRGVGVALDFGLKIVEVLKGKGISQKLREAMVLPLNEQ